MGLAGWFRVRAKIMMRRLWSSETKLDWDEPIPKEFKQGWIELFKYLFQMEEIRIQICLNESQGAYWACSYARWECSDGKYQSRLVASKNRLFPVKKISIDRVELCAAVLNKRLKAVIESQGINSAIITISLTHKSFVRWSRRKLMASTHLRPRALGNPRRKSTCRYN